MVRLLVSDLPCYAPLVESMLSTPSVEFLLAMERRGFLTALVGTARSGGAAWDGVRRALRKAWPAKMRVGNDGGGGDEAARTALECPITLMPCVHPVVASDGRTYERDAILTHMATGDNLSPVTKTPLGRILFDNYAA